MEPTEEEDDVKLAKASVGLLADLESQLAKLLWKRSKSDGARGSVHSCVRQKDLDYVIRLVDPFQSEPHLLDSRLKSILPPIIEAYLEALLKPALRKTEVHVDIQTALSCVLYTFCKVRGPKVIVGFLNNEPRYLEPVLSSLETVSRDGNSEDVDWKVSYILLLWLSHLLLTPFDLASISAGPVLEGQKTRLDLPGSVPPVAQRILHLGVGHLSSPTKVQDAAAAMLVRLATRPDMQKLQLADMLVDFAINELSPCPDLPTTIYQQVGPLRFLAGVATSADLGHLIPGIHRACERLYGDTSLSPIARNAVGKKLIVKIFRNIAILTLRSSSASGALLSFLETTDVLEDVIDHLLQSLGDRDTPVRYAAAKAISLIVSELELEMGHEVIQAVLDTFKEDIPRNASNIDYQTVNALKWHGLTLTLSHALFKRSASPEQLPDILDALVSALNFEQRTATGSSIGTNVRDAANFGLWSLSRRYTSNELLSVQVKDLRSASPMLMQSTVIQAVAVQLLLSACLDPAGNIRRGSSAALQELIGRHPNQVIDGIAVVQIVDYQAVGLRKRALVDVACKAASLHHLYWTALVEGLVAWRGLGSVDAISREAAAQSLADLVAVGKKGNSLPFVSERLHKQLVNSSGNDIESLHGLLSALANMLRLPVALLSNGKDSTGLPLLHREYWAMVESQGVLQVDFNPRTLKSELPVAITKLVTEVCRVERINCKDRPATFVSSSRAMESIVQRLLTRQEDQILQALPDMARQLYQVRILTYEPLGCLDASTLSEAVTKDGTKAVLSGAGKAIALGATAFLPKGQLAGEEATISITTLTGLVTAMNVDWRIIGLRALDLVLQDLHTISECDSNILTTTVQAIHDGLTDYTIDERGDIGSLVRLQGLVCASRLLSLEGFDSHSNHYQLLQGDVLRLSLEKLDRVRSNAASCRRNCLPIRFDVNEIENVNSETYLRSALHPIFDPQTPPWAHRALLEGAISCAGISGESMLQTARTILTESLHTADEQHLQTTLVTFSDILRDLLSPSTPNAGNLMLAALELLAFLLDMRIPQRLARPETTTTAFKWRSLLSTVQKSHHKSTDVPKLLAAVSVYRGLAEIESLRGEVVKKLLSMLATNPYPRVRLAVAEVVFEVLGGEEMKGLNWAEKGPGQSKVLAELKREAVGSV